MRILKTPPTPEAVALILAAAKNPHAVALGSRKSKKKAAAAKINGKKGGYPKGRKRKSK